MALSTTTHLYTYPIKSTIGQSLQESTVLERGLAYDRQWGVFDQDGIAVTGRKFQDLLRLETRIADEQLAIYLENESLFSIPITLPNKDSIPAQVFSGRTAGIPISQEIDAWFSNFLGISCRFLHINPQVHRAVLPKHGGQEDDTVNFADQCPVLLLSEASLADLNSKMDQAISHRNFRPNIVISGQLPFEEDQWRRIKIGSCEFDINQSCERCVFTTIDPDSREKNPRQEPLRTLATYRKNARGGAIFGVHMTPRVLGKIRVGDEVTVLA